MPYCYAYWLRWAGLLAGLLAAGSGWAQPGTKRALLVAAGRYQPGTGWEATAAAHDARLVGEVLRRHGFPGQQVRTLGDTAATKAGIVAALALLARQAGPGDVVVFQFAGHGRLLADDANQDEADGYDEALVPTDAPRTLAPGHYDDPRYLRDDELGRLLEAIRRRLGPTGQLLVLLDACYSGTATRSLGLCRGTAEPLAPSGYRPRPPAATARPDTAAAGTHQAPLVVFSAAGPHERDEETQYQGQPVGPLSLAFAQALSQPGELPSYEHLFDRIRLSMAASAPRQTPQLEGAGPGRLFGGRYTPVPAHFKPLRWQAGQQQVLLDGGTLHGLFAGSQVAFYRPNADPARARPLATGQVTASDAASATVQLARPLAGPVPPVWAFVTAHSPGPLTLRLHLALPPGQLLARQLPAALAQWPWVHLVPATQAELQLVRDPAGSDTLRLLNDQGLEVYATGPNRLPGVVQQEILAALRRVAQARYLGQLHARAPGVRVELELVPCATAAPAAGPAPACHPAGQLCQLRATNYGSQTAYLSLLYLAANDQLSLLLPAPGRAPADYAVLAGQRRLLPDTIRLNPTYGRALLKLLSTSQPLALRDFIGGQTRAPGGALERLLAFSYAGQGSRALPPALPAATVHTYEVPFCVAAP